MPSSFGWIDYDAKEREGVNRLLALFREKNSRDELGLGAIRDSIADQLFPGTSVIQTRLRYLLFIPWLYQDLESQRVSSEDVPRSARLLEVEMIEPLLDDNETGVLGRVARGNLKRLPSSVYWNAMTSWGLMEFQGSQDDYHRSFDRLHMVRAQARRRDDQDLHDAPARTWHPGLPAAPANFPNDISFKLRRSEAEYLRHRVCERHPGSLLAWLVNDPGDPPEHGYVWEHPRRGGFRAEHRELVHNAHMFAEIMQGAALLYNLELARQRGSEELIHEHTEGLAQWLDRILTTPLHGHVLDWNPARFWALVSGKGHTITEPTRWFVEAWHKHACAGTLDAVDGDDARKLVRRREVLLKRAQSRFENKRALEQWTGRAGLGLLSYRWPNVVTFLHDLAAGLSNDEET